MAKLGQMDIGGACVFVSAIVCLILALQWGGTTYPWSSGRVWGCLIAFGLLIIVFVLLQWKLGDRATMPPRVLGGSRTVAASAVFTSFMAMALYT